MATVRRAYHHHNHANCICRFAIWRSFKQQTLGGLLLYSLAVELHMSSGPAYSMKAHESFARVISMGLVGFTPSGQYSVAQYTTSHPLLL